MLFTARMRSESSMLARLTCTLALMLANRAVTAAMINSVIAVATMTSTSVKPA